MELERAHEILGLASSASAEEIESIYRRVRDDLDARLGSVRSAALRAHYTRLRQLIEPARDTALAALEQARLRSAEPNGDAFEVLGLAPGASALDVASAYVTLCDELERELAASPVEAVRRACLAARAEIDAAYQRCAARPLHKVGAADEADGAASRYETQLADAPFEVAPGPAVASEARASERNAARERGRPKRVRRRRLRWIAAVALLAALAGAGAAFLRGRIPPDASALLARFARVGPPAELLEAHNTAEYLRRRMGDERLELQARVEENRARVTRLEEEWTAARDPADYDRMAVEIGRARARAELTEEIAALSETYVFESADVAEAYGKIELGTELEASGDLEEATEAFEAAWLGLEQALGRLDLAEEAVGARSEAQAALEAWEGLARSSGLEETEAARTGREVFARGRVLLEQGAFAEAVPELRGAARHFTVAIDDGRKRLADGEAPTGLTPAPPPVASPPPGLPHAAPTEGSGSPARDPSLVAPDSHLAGS
ncbi:MAG TPA: hypothetical protein VNF72_15330 [Myxococcota bacterium]|nr:hypothetical protein [Myxococcota bacterium]